MPIRTPKARQLATQPELKLYESSLRGAVTPFSAAQLRQRLTRARKARDKYAQLAKRQRREARGKAEPRGSRAAQGNARTLEKVQLFQETMDRFEKRIQVVEAKDAKKPAAAAKRTPPGKKTVARKKAAAKRSAPKKATPKKKATSKKKATRKKKAVGLSAWKTATRPKRKAATKKKAAAKKTAQKAPKKTEGAGAAQRKARAGVARTQRHVAARGRRSQAKRDAKR